MTTLRYCVNGKIYNTYAEAQEAANYNSNNIKTVFKEHYDYLDMEDVIKQDEADLEEFN